MLRRKLGRTGLEVPIIGLGLGALRKKPTGFNQPMEEVGRLLDRALERGANFIHVYAGQEQLIGRMLSGRRKEFIIAAHVDVYSDPKRKMGTADEIMGRVESCLKDLQTDCVELFQFHGVMNEESLDFIRTGGALEGLKKAQEQGKIQYMGITGHLPPPLVNALKGDDFDTVMVPFNVMRRQFGADPSIGLFPLAKQMDIGVIIMKPIARARVTRNLSTAFKFIFAHDVTLAIPGARNVRELDEDIDAAEEFTALSEEERKQYADELFILGEPYCWQCGYCLPCPGEMNIPAILRMERTCEFYGLREWIRASEVGKLEVYPERCKDCGICEPRCPFDLPIRDMIRNAQQYRQPDR